MVTICSGGAPPPLHEDDDDSDVFILLLLDTTSVDLMGSTERFPESQMVAIMEPGRGERLAEGFRREEDRDDDKDEEVEDEDVALAAPRRPA